MRMPTGGGRGSPRFRGTVERAAAVDAAATIAATVVRM